MKRSLDSRVDYSLLLPVFFLLVIGVVAIYIAVSHDYPNNQQEVQRNCASPFLMFFGKLDNHTGQHEDIGYLHKF